VTKTEALADHVLIIDRLAPHRIVKPEHRHVPAVDRGRKLTDAGEPIYDLTTGDVHHLGDETWSEVPWACSCGEPMSTDPVVAVEEWLKHAEGLSGLPSDLLREHLIVHLGMAAASVLVRGGATSRSAVTCGCSKQFLAGSADPSDPGAAIAAWVEHLTELAELAEESE